MFVSFSFEAVDGLAPLTATLPSNTSIYNEWPPKHLRVTLPKFQRVASLIPDNASGNFTSAELPEYDGHRLMSPPIHVRDGDFLSVSVKNSLQSTGLSIHWHGFEMEGHLELDGVVGITQCPISPRESFTYAWEVKETPGTYWYHTHSGELGIDSYNALMGPLIVHPKIPTEEEEVLDSPQSEGMPFLDPALYSKDPQAQQRMSFDDLLFYGNERILFFKDGSLHSGAHKLLEQTGGLNPPISYNDDSFSVGTFPWHFGTCNGKMREVVPASPGQTLKFRILNAGSMYALRVAFDGLRITVVAADSEPVEPVEMDEIILGPAERFDVLVTIPEDEEVGSTSWIRADTLESRYQGYQNGIRAILHIVDPNSSTLVDSNAVPDPKTPIETNTDHKAKLTYNCYSQIETLEKSGDGGCVPVSALRLEDSGKTHGAVTAAKAASAPVEMHVVDWQFSASPQFAHFVRIDGGKWYQFAMFQGHSMLLPEFDAEAMLHPNGAVLHVDAGVSAIVIWRSKTSMDHPIHLHGRKMEILDEHIVKKSENCDLDKCELSEVFTSDDALRALANIPPGTRPLKDTFILPAGGAVATRFFTGEPALWFAHCHLEAHREDGMAMILNVGNYQAPADRSWLPSDYPKCDTSFLLSTKEFPACDCFINADAVMGNALTTEHRCSRDYLCFHEDSPQSNLKVNPYGYGETGIAIRSQYTIPGWAVSLLIVVVIALIACLIAYRNKLITACKREGTKEGKESKEMSLSPGEEHVEIHAGVKVDSSKSQPTSKVAVLFINMQNEFVNEKGKLHSVVEEGMNKDNIVANAIELALCTRKNGAVVIHAPTILEESDHSDMSKYSTSEQELFRAGTWNAEIASNLLGEGDTIFATKTYNAYTSELKSFLEKNNVKKLLICGFTIDVSVEETLHAAFSETHEDTELFTVEDCCVASSVNRPHSLQRQKSRRLVSRYIDLNQAKLLIANQNVSKVHTVAGQPKKTRRSSVTFQIKRDLPLSMDLPSDPRRLSKKKGSRVSVLNRLSFLGRNSTIGNNALPVAAKDFTVPSRRSQIDFKVDGFKISGNVDMEKEETDINEESSFQEQFLFLCKSEWSSYRPTCISLLRVTEVTSLAFFTGALFYSIGEDTTATGFGSINSLLFFSVTLWTFTRMYPAINTYCAWNQSLRIIANEHRYSLVPACLARTCVVFLAESGWPFLFVFVCYPLASMAGSWSAMFKIGLMLSLNNICYISIGSVLGIVVDKIPKGMITSTIVAQSSLVAAGFYTNMPAFLSWLRYLSPVFWSYRGIVKSAFEWSDTFKCRWGSTLSGVNSCFIEYHTAINNLKERGINAATFGNDQSTQIWLECIVLILFYLAMQGFILSLSLFRQLRDYQWEINLERLAEFKAIYGDVNVPTNHFSGDVALGSWVERTRQRKKYLTDEQVERLNELAFIW